MRVKLELPTARLNELHEAVNKSRKNAQTVAVPREALAALLRDHGALVREFRAEIGGEV